MELDKELIQARIDIIERNLKLLGEIALQGYENLKNSFRDELAAKHALQEAIEACLDVANHIISVKGFRRPTDYKDIFNVLREEKIISNELYKKLESMIKFRNLLVHRYGEIETKKLYQIMKLDLKDINEFVRQVLRIIK